MGREFNEGKACDAVVRFLEHRVGNGRFDLQTPDADRDPDPVDLAVRIMNTRYALEHTGIEPFDSQIDLAKASQVFFAPLLDRIRQVVPAGETYYLQFPYDAASCVKPRAYDVCRDALFKWIVFTAPRRSLHARHRLDVGCQNMEVEGVPFPVSLTRQQRPNEHWPSARISVFPPEGDEWRVRRIARAIDKKMPKLIAWKQKHQARSVLVFENADIQLTNHIAVTEAVLSVLKARTDRPDEIYLVESCHEPWWVIPVLIDNTSAVDLGENWCWQIFSTELEDLTDRG